MYSAARVEAGMPREAWWEVTGGERPYRVRHGEGRWGCECKAFTFGKGKQCKHIQLVRSLMSAGASNEYLDKQGVIRHPSLAVARAAVMAEVGYVQKTRVKDGKGPGYTFASEAAITGAMHEACAKHGVLIAPSSVHVVEREQYESRGGGRMTRTVLRVTYSLRHAFSADSDTVEALGEAADVGDKSIPKAMTIAYKYALRQLNMLETGDDPDEVPSEDVAPASHHRQPPPPSRHPPAPPRQAPPPPRHGPAGQPPPPRQAPPNGSAPPGGPRSVLDRLRAFESEAVARGLVEPGELEYEAVRNFGGLLGNDPAQWSDGVAGDVSLWAKSYISRAKEVASA